MSLLFIHKFLFTQTPFNPDKKKCKVGSPSGASAVSKHSHKKSKRDHGRDVPRSKVKSSQEYEETRHITTDLGNGNEVNVKSTWDSPESVERNENRWTP